MNLSLFRSTAMTLITGGVMFVGMARAAEIAVLASPATREAYLELVPAFEKASGHKVVTMWAGTADIMKRIKDGEAVDAVVLSTSSLEELIKLGKIVPGSRVDLAKSGVGVAVRAGAPKPDISSGEALKRALLAAKSIAYSSGPSGTYLAGLFQRMGIADEIKPKLKQAPPGVAVGDFVARGEADIGFQQVSELLAVSGIDYIGPLPPDIQSITVFAGGIHAGAKEADAARAWFKFLTAPAAAPVMKKHGMEPG
jgi:molybdate transport system substrate-binding protein